MWLWVPWRWAILVQLSGYELLSTVSYIWWNMNFLVNLWFNFFADFSLVKTKLWPLVLVRQRKQKVRINCINWQSIWLVSVVYSSQIRNVTKFLSKYWIVFNKCEIMWQLYWTTNFKFKVYFLEDMIWGIFTF